MKVNQEQIGWLGEEIEPVRTENRYRQWKRNKANWKKEYFKQKQKL